VVHLSGILILAELRRSLRVDWLGTLGKTLVITALTWFSAEIAVYSGAPWVLALIFTVVVAVASGYLLLNRELLQVWRSLLAPKLLVPS
jgi:hypothetical protein